MRRFFWSLSLLKRPALWNQILRPDDLNFAVKTDLDNLGGLASGSGFETGIYGVVNRISDFL